MKSLAWLAAVKDRYPNSDLHHLFSVGMGRNRKKALWEHYTVVPLKHDVHMDLHSLGDEKFLAKHGVSADEMYQEVLERLIAHDLITRKQILKLVAQRVFEVYDGERP